MKQPVYRRLASLFVLTLCNSNNQRQISYIARFNQHNPKGDCWLKSRRDLFTLLNCADFLSVVGICWCFTFLFLALEVCVYFYYFVEFVDVLKNLTFLFALFGFSVIFLLCGFCCLFSPQSFLLGRTNVAVDSGSRLAFARLPSLATELGVRLPECL